MIARRSLLAGLALGLAIAPMAPALAAPWQLERSDVLSLRGPEGDEYRIMISWPDGDAPPQGWPVLWLLDGEEHFPIATLTARKIGRGRGGRNAPAPVPALAPTPAPAASVQASPETGIIVAIDAGSRSRRSRDYTPPVTNIGTVPAGRPGSGLPTGGADAFLAFLGQKVRPEIARRWRIDPERQTLMGHSFGGLFALHALARGGFWTRYVAVSPSLWFGDGAVQRTLADTGLTPGTKLLIASGDQEGRGRPAMDGQDAGEQGTAPAQPAATQPEGEMLAAHLSARGFDARYILLTGQSHGTTMAAMLRDGIMMAFGSISG